jgi:hypothetical protein
VIAPAVSSLKSLAARLTEPSDREAYAALVSYVNSLPPGDELSRLAEMLGLVSLLSQRIPDAIGELLVELRHEKVSVRLYGEAVDSRLANLPHEMACGVDVGAVAAELAERFRAQIKETGLYETASLLRNGAREMRSVSADMAAALRPLAAEYKATSETVAAELVKLVSAARVVEAHNARLIARERSQTWIWTALVGTVMLIVGLACGLMLARQG